MTDLGGYLKSLKDRQESLRLCVSRLGAALHRMRGLETLNELARVVRLRQSSIVMDWDATFPARRARVWVVVGPGGIPDDMEVVSEAMSLFGQSGEVHQPDLEGFLAQRRSVLSGKEFLLLAEWLSVEVMAERVGLPYQAS